jgi:hypothetical protein
MKLRRMRRSVQVASIAERRNACKILDGRTDGIRPLGKLKQGGVKITKGY